MPGVPGLPAGRARRPPRPAPARAGRPGPPGRHGRSGRKYRGVSDLIGELLLMPVEGGARVAIIEAAERMNEDAQSALLKTLEEPPAGVTIILCADGEARLLPTVRSRCFRVRLGLVGPRDIEAIVADHGLADPPTAARLGRLAGGRPGLALAYARAPDAVLIRAELTRLLLDMTDARPATRLAAARAAVPRAIALAAALDGRDPARRRPPGRRRAAGQPPARRRSRRSARATPGRRRPGDRRTTDGDRAAQAPARNAGAPSSSCSGCGPMSPATSCSSARTVSRRSTTPSCSRSSPPSPAAIDPADARHSSSRAASRRVAGRNVSPELILDSLVLAWPRPGGRLTRRRDPETGTVRLDATVSGHVSRASASAISCSARRWRCDSKAGSPTRPDGAVQLCRRGPRGPTSSSSSGGSAKVRCRRSSSGSARPGCPPRATLGLFAVRSGGHPGD